MKITVLIYRARNPRAFQVKQNAEDNNIKI